MSAPEKGEESTIFQNQSRFINSRIDNVQKHFGSLCTSFSGYASTTAKLRNKGDDVAKSLIDYSEVETVNKSLRISLLELSEIVISIQDYRNTLVKRLESGVVSKFLSYDRMCNSKRDELRKNLEARRKEITRQKVIERNSGRTRTLSGKESSRTRMQIEKQMDTFEQTKIEDLKSILQDYTKTELAFHAKALELYTKAYQKTSLINSEDDMEEFRNVLRGSHLDDREVEEEMVVREASPIILGGKEKRNSSHITEMSKSTEKLQIQDYEEIVDYSSSDEE